MSGRSNHSVSIWVSRGSFFTTVGLGSDRVFDPSKAIGRDLVLEGLEQRQPTSGLLVEAHLSRDETATKMGEPGKLSF